MEFYGQLKYLELIQSVEFAFGCCSLELSIWGPKDGMSMQLKEVIIRLQKYNKPRENN